MSKTKIILFVVIAACLIAGGRWYNNTLDERAAQQVLAAEEKAREAELKALSTIEIKDLVVGAGAEAKKGSTLNVNYIGEFLDGKKFDSSYDRQAPIDFVLGDEHFIRGWSLGIAGMKTGGKRTFIVPPELAYGSQGNDLIPPSSTLKFTVELLAVDGSTSTKPF